MTSPLLSLCHHEVIFAPRSSWGRTSFTHRSVKLKEKKPFHNLSHPHRPPLHQNKVSIKSVCAVLVKHERWWSCDVYNNVQVLEHIKSLYGHIIKKRHYRLDRCASWSQMANDVLMHPGERRPPDLRPTAGSVAILHRLRWQIVNERLIKSHRMQLYWVSSWSRINLCGRLIEYESILPK